jgi:hypothetical protein
MLSCSGSEAWLGEGGWQSRRVRVSRVCRDTGRGTIGFTPSGVLWWVPWPGTEG